MIRCVFLTCIVFLFGIPNINLTAQSSQQDSLTTYDEAIFIISNYSGISATTPEESTITELLENDVNGFRFYVRQDNKNKLLLVKNPDNSYMPLQDVLDIIRETLDVDSTRILTLFLDFNFSPDLLENAFHGSGLHSYLYIHDVENNWPSLQSLVSSNQRLVIFSTQVHINSPSWLHYIWHFAIKPLSLSSDDISSANEIFDGDPQKHLLVFNGFNSPSIIEMQNELNNPATQNPYYIEMLKRVWISNGKTPNFVMMDRYDSSIASSLDRIREFGTIKGTVTHDNEILHYVNWKGLNSLTGGRFSFVIFPGEEITLAPLSPGYKFKPASIKVDESLNNRNLNFRAVPLKITEDLEACYLFDDNAKDASSGKNNGQSINVVYTNDPDRSLVASLRETSLIRLAKAETFKMRDHDFTVAVWVKIQEYPPDNSDQCILSSRTAIYQSGLHFVIRNRRPYLGFLNDDLAGNSIIEEGKWYHIVWRYNRQSKEQAIYVNGKLDAVSLRRPSYKGSDTIYVGAIYSPELSLKGEIDDLCIWSRALGDKEIVNLSGQKYHIESHLGFLRITPVYIYLLSGVIVILIVFLTFKRVKRLKQEKTFLHKEDIFKSPSIADKPPQNYIRLFGDFMVLDKQGNNITALFSPKLKQLFLILLVHSQQNKHGISTKDLSQILWKGHPIKDTKNLRGVTIRNLRKVLETIDKIDIQFQSEYWSVQLSSGVYCDFFECLKLLENKQLHKSNKFLDLYNIIKGGELFVDESYYWLDDTKGYIGNQIVDVMLNYLETHPDIPDNDLINGLTEQVLIYDPVNDVALSHKMKALIEQNNHHLAKFTYERFCSLYEEMYGEPFGRSFDELIT